MAVRQKLFLLLVLSTALSEASYAQKASLANKVFAAYMEAKNDPQYLKSANRAWESQPIEKSSVVFSLANISVFHQKLKRSIGLGILKKDGEPPSQAEVCKEIKLVQNVIEVESESFFNLWTLLRQRLSFEQVLVFTLSDVYPDFNGVFKLGVATA